MRLPGTRYQEHGWEQVRKLLGQCSLQAFRRIDLGLALDPDQHAVLLDSYTEAVAAALRASEKSARAGAEGNSYGDSVGELALSLLFELQAQTAYWQGFATAVAAEHARHGDFWLDPAAEGVLRKKVNDMYAGLRDKVDADNYIVATGRACSPNKIYTYRMLDTAYREIAGLFADWHLHAGQVGAILNRSVGDSVDCSPIEARRMKSISACQAEWIVRWSETLERYGGAPGPLHTKSKRFSSLKNSPEKIAAMLAEIGDYEELSSNRDRADDWHGDAGEAALWLEDYWRVLGESEQGQASEEDDRILPAPVDTDDGAAGFDDDADADADAGADMDDGDLATTTNASTAPVDHAAEQALAGALSLPPRYLELARAAQDAGSWVLRTLHEESLPVRLAVYHKLLGAADDSYPDAWLDPASGELPTLQQLAALDRISMPTLRKRRNEAIAKLQA